MIEDIEWLQKVLKKENPSTVVDFERLGNVISILGDEITKTTKHNNVDPESGLTIVIDDIKLLCSMFLTKAERAGFREVAIDVGSYWTINPECAYDFTNVPTPELQQFEEIQFEEQQHLFHAQHFEAFGRLIKIVGQVIGKPENLVFWLTTQ